MGYTRGCLGVLVPALILVTAENTSAQVSFLNQNWSDSDRQFDYNTSQGSRMMPYEWFKALYVTDEQGGRKSLLNHVLDLGYLPNAQSPDGLPVGFAVKSLLSPYRDVDQGNGRTGDDLFHPDAIRRFLRELDFSRDEAMKLVESYDEKLDDYYKDLRKAARMGVIL